jgi:sodium-independent sulfate anion transporter 11
MEGAGTENAGITIPEDTVVVSFKDALFYPNAQRNKTHVLESIQLVYPAVQSPNYRADTERSWSVAGDRRLARLRRERNIVMKDMPLSVVVWDFTMVPFIDVTGITALAELKDDIRRLLGNIVEIRLVNLAPGVRKRFERTKWLLADVDGPQCDGADIIYPLLERAVWDDRESLKGVVTEKA